jgi:hypothetical protein
MKKTIPIIGFLFVFSVLVFPRAVQAQSTFTVIKVSGSVYSTSMDRAVKRGDVLAPSDKLKFDSQQSYMHVVGQREGLKTVRDASADSPRELMDLLQTFVNNKSANSSRGAVSTEIEKIRHQLAYNAMLILGDGRINVTTEEISLKSPSGIKASYALKGNKVDKVISDESGFNLGKSFIFKSHGDQKFPQITVTYYEDVNDRFFSAVEILGAFTPFYTEEDNLLKELKVLIGILEIAGGDTQSIESNVVTYLTSEYEAPILPNLRDWLSKNELLTY